MIEVDGSFGEGGGQIVRSSLALSMVTGSPVTIQGIRAGRRPPGLKRQHVTAVSAAAQICGATSEGATLGSKRLVFIPGIVRPGSYHFDIGSAGSTTLVLQTILPALSIADGESNVLLEGGTHNQHAPPFDFLDRAYLPLINRMGPTLVATLHRPGFYPVGRGRLEVMISPAAQLARVEIMERGAVRQRRVCALFANLPEHIAQRECRTIARKTGWDKSCFEVVEVPNSKGPGNVVIIEIKSQHLTEIFSGFGQKGVPAEKVAMRATKAASRYLAAQVPIGEHLADQLMLPLGIGAHLGTGGGIFRTLDTRTCHTGRIRPALR